MRTQLHNIRRGGALLIKHGRIHHHGTHLETQAHRHAKQHCHSKSQHLEHSHNKGSGVQADYSATKKRISPIKYKF